MNLAKSFLNLYNSELKYIWSYTFDEGNDNELILDPKCIFLEVNNKFLQLCDSERKGEIEITISDKEVYTSDMENTYKIDVTRFVLGHSETNYFIEKIGGIDMIIRTEKIICKAAEIYLFTENFGNQKVFICSGLYGLRIGGMNLKKDWIDNYYIPANGGKVVESWILK